MNFKITIITEAKAAIYDYPVLKTLNMIKIEMLWLNWLMLKKRNDFNFSCCRLAKLHRVLVFNSF